MESHCPCCGVKFDEGQVGEFDVECGMDEEEEALKHNFKYRTDMSNIICLWCANSVPSGIIDVIFNHRKEFYTVTKDNFMEQDNIKKRIEKVSKQSCFSCPRCGREMKDKMSYGLNEIVKKCKDCGWC